MKDRIRQLMEAQHMNQQTFASMTGISTASLSSIFNGRTKPTLNHVEAIRSKFPSINLAWLLYGEGGMFTPAGGAPIESPTPSSAVDTQGSSSYAQDSPTFGQDPTQPALFEQPQKTDNLAEGMLDFGDPAVPQTHTPSVGRRPHSSAQSQVQTQVQTQVRQPSFAMQMTAQKRITEIRVFYDDQTWESFVPKK